MMEIPKKLINEPDQMASELLEGVVAAYHGKVRQLSEQGALVKTQLTKGKVGLVIGGVCGHEPLFSMLIGENLADGAACGNVYHAPEPPVILETTRAVDQGKGVLFVYGNWRGNIDRFGPAEKMAIEAGIEVKTVRVWDDVAAAPIEGIEKRGGIAGDLLVIKVAGAVTAHTDSLEHAYDVTSRARDNTRTIGVALSSGTIPGTGELLYALPKDKIEIGSKLHGQGGVLIQKTALADEIVECMMDQIFADGLFVDGDEVCLLINHLGNMSYLELLIANRRVRQILKNRNITVRQTFIGSYFTCQETAGFSVTMMKLDEELDKCIDLPAFSLGFSTSGHTKR